MERDIADLLNDAFSDTFLLSYQDEELNFDSLNFNENDEERDETTGFIKLPVLKEVDEEVLNSIFEEDYSWGISKVLEGESLGETTNLQSLDEDAVEEVSNRDDSIEDKDEDNIEGINDELDSKGDKYEYEVMESSNKEEPRKAKDKNIVLDESNNVKLDSNEDEGDGMDDSYDYSSNVIRQQKESFQDQGEDMENAQNRKVHSVNDEEDENDASSKKCEHDASHHFPHSVQTDRQQDKENIDASESKEVESYGGEIEILDATGSGNREFSEGQSFLVNEDVHGHFFEGLLQQLGDDVKEFSEDDQGVIGEDYAEYPSECFQQEDKEERRKKVEDIQTESKWKTGELSERLQLQLNAHLGGEEVFEWELLERNTAFHDEDSKREETGGDIPDEKQGIDLKDLKDLNGTQNMLLEKKNTEEQNSEGDCLTNKGQDMEEKGSVEDEMVEGIQEVKRLPCSFTLTMTDKGNSGDSEPLKDRMPIAIIHGGDSFIGVQAENGLFQSQNKTRHNSQEPCLEKDVNWRSENERQREVGKPPENESLIEGLCNLSTEAVMSSSDRGEEDFESITKPFESPKLPTTWSHKNTGEMSTQVMTPIELALKISWLETLESENPLIYETKNSQETFTNECLADTWRSDGDLRTEEKVQMAELEEGKCTGISDYEFCNVLETQQQKFQSYDEEDQRNYEQDKQRIEAFYRYYNDDPDESSDARHGGQNPKKPTVRFCLEPSPLKDTESSDLEDGVSSSSDGIEDYDTSQTRHSLELEEDSDDYPPRDYVLLLQQSCATQKELLNLSTELKTYRQRDKNPRMLKSFLKMCLTTIVGVLFFWWVTDQLDWMG